MPRKYDVAKASSEDDSNAKGIGWPLAACFLLGDLAGAGMMALPVAMVQGGVVFGTIVSFICCTASAYSAALLGENLMIMRRRWPEYREHNGKPYIEMAKRSLGPVGETILKIMIYCTAMGIIIVFLLLAANNISSFLNGNFGIRLHKCFCLLIVGVILWPLVMPRSPMDFGWVAIAASGSTGVAVCIIIWGSAHDLESCSPHADYTAPHSLETMALTFGTVMFSYGGHVAFPTIQMDMKRPAEFWKSVYFTFSFLFIIMFTPVSVFGYYVYGNSMTDTIINSIQMNWMQQVVSVMMTIHVVTSYIIIGSPLAQGVESMFNTPEAFSSRRFLVRSGLLWFTVFVALSVPRFGVILDLVGGSFSTSIALIWPGLFYLLLSAGEKKREEQLVSGEKVDEEDTVKAGWKDMFTYNPPLVVAAISLVTLLGICGGICATSTAFIKLLGAEFEAPCYVQLFTSRGLSLSDAGGTVNCCGVGKNVSVWPDADVRAYCARH